MSVDNERPDTSSEFHIDHIGVSVADLNRSIAFYTKNLGFTCDRVIDLPARNGRVALLRRADFAIEMFEFAGVLPLPDYRKTPDSDLRTIGVKHFAVRVKNIVGAYEILKKNGVELSSNPAVGVRGLRRFFLKDPDGIQIEVTEY